MFSAMMVVASWSRTAGKRSQRAEMTYSSPGQVEDRRRMGIEGEEVRMRMLLWVAGALMLVAAAMLIAEVGAAALWIAVITVGIATVVVAQARTRHGFHG
jgi:hypothetical protein